MQSSVRAMSALIDNVLDFARGRLGGGIALSRSGQPLEPVLNQVIAEFRASAPEREIETSFRADASRSTATADASAQLFSNLLGNALTHGSAASPIRVRATTQDGAFELSVANSGEPIPPDAMDRLFQPFYRARAGLARQGLGLGLYIASEIARAHGGTIGVASSPEETRFTFRMPLR